MWKKTPPKWLKQMDDTMNGKARTVDHLIIWEIILQIFFKSPESYTTGMVNWWHQCLQFFTTTIMAKMFWLASSLWAQQCDLLWPMGVSKQNTESWKYLWIGICFPAPLVPWPWTWGYPWANLLQECERHMEEGCFPSWGHPRLASPIVIFSWYPFMSESKDS